MDYTSILIRSHHIYSPLAAVTAKYTLLPWKDLINLVCSFLLLLPITPNTPLTSPKWLGIPKSLIFWLLLHKMDLVTSGTCVRKEPGKQSHSSYLYYSIIIHDINSKV